MPLEDPLKNGTSFDPLAHCRAILKSTAFELVAGSFGGKHELSPFFIPGFVQGLYIASRERLSQVLKFSQFAFHLMSLGELG